MKIIKEVDKNAVGVEDNNNVKDNQTINKELEKLRYDMRTKIEQLKHNNHIYNTIKENNKMNSSFEESIDKMSHEMVKLLTNKHHTVDTKEKDSKKKK